MYRQNRLKPNHRKWIILSAFFLIGFFLRIYNLPGDWMSDSARDYLYAKHIVYYQEYPLLGPYAMGSYTFYPPYYYYLLSLPLYINSDLFFPLFLIVLINSFSIILIYLIVASLFDNKAGLAASFFFTLSSTQIVYNSTLWSAYIVITPALLSILFFTRFLKTKRKKYFRFSLTVASLSALIHYSALPLIPAFLLWAVCKKIISFKSIVLNSLLSITPAIILHIPLFIFPNPPVSLFPKINLWQIFISFFSPYKLWENYILYLKSVNILFPDRLFIVLSLAVFIFPLVGLNKKYYFNFRSTALFLFLLIIVYLSFAPLLYGGCCSHFFTVISPLFIISLAISVRRLFLILKKYPALSLMIFPVLVIFSFFLTKNNALNKNYFHQINNLSNIIARDILSIRKNKKIEKYDFFRVYYFQDYFSDGTYQLWYFLENKLKSKIVTIKNNFLTQTGNGDFIYLLCENGELNGCQQKFKEYNPGNFRQSILWQDKQYQILRYEE